MKKEKLSAKLNSLLIQKEVLFDEIKKTRNELESIKDEEILKRRHDMKNKILECAKLVLNGSSFKEAGKKLKANPGSLHNNFHDLLKKKNPEIYELLDKKAEEKGYYFPLMQHIRQYRLEFLKFL